MLLISSAVQRISDSNGCDQFWPNKSQAYHLNPLGQFSFFWKRDLGKYTYYYYDLLVIDNISLANHVSYNNDNL